MKKFRFAWWRLHHWPLLILAVITLLQVFRSLTTPGAELVPLWLRLVVIAGGLLMLAILVWGIAQFFASYFLLSDEGVGERRWPGSVKIVPWDKVENIRQIATLGIFRSDVLVYKEDRRISNLETKEEHNGFTLNDFAGWPKGALANELRKLRPQVFK